MTECHITDNTGVFYFRNHVSTKTRALCLSFRSNLVPSTFSLKFGEAEKVLGMRLIQNMVSFYNIHRDFKKR